MRARPALERFWGKVSVRGEDEYWPWLGGKDGGFHYLDQNYCHRVAYRIAHESVPDRIVRLCELNLCCNDRHYKAKSLDLIDRFWSQVSIGSWKECWIWEGGTNADGYGTIRVDGKLVLTHRFSYKLQHGSIPVGLIVMHTCDTPPCINPRHLVAGTNADNKHDAMRKGRMTIPMVKGERHGMAKLSSQDVARIISLNEPSSVTAARFGISPGHVRRIRRRERWGHMRNPRGLSGSAA